MHNSMYISIFISILCLIISSYGAPPTIDRNHGHHQEHQHPLIYWSHLVNGKEALQNLANYERQCAADVGHIEYLKTFDYTDKGPDFKPIAPMMLFPSKYPRRIFDQAEALQPAMNLLYFRASRDYEFLQQAFAETAKGDHYIQTLLDILGEMQEHGYRHQPLAFQLQRADYYMCYGKNAAKDDVSKYELKQIEVNIGPAGGPPNAIRQTKVHRKVLTKLGLDASLELLRDNHPYTTYVEPLILAWHQFGDPDAIMLIAVGMGVKGKTVGKKTQWDLEEEIERLSSGKLKYRLTTYRQCASRCRLAEDNSLMFKPRDKDGNDLPEVKVAVVMHRYKTNDDEEEWKARRLMERSTAIKGPSIGMELIGTKKGQQALAKPGAVERFFGPGEEHYAEAVRQTFAGLWGLDNEEAETKRVIEDAIAHPENYVMKPMKEGGGNNFFGQTVADKLQQLDQNELAAHILMERLQPVSVPNYFVRTADEQPAFGMVVPELSTFGGLLGNIQDGTVLHNHGHGVLTRTKPEDSDEGGIFSGIGAYDTPYLY